MPDDESLEQLSQRLFDGVVCPTHGTPLAPQIVTDESGDTTMEFNACCEDAQQLIEDTLGDEFMSDT